MNADLESFGFHSETYFRGVFALKLLLRCWRIEQRAGCGPRYTTASNKLVEALLGARSELLLFCVFCRLRSGHVVRGSYHFWSTQRLDSLLVRHAEVLDTGNVTLIDTDGLLVDSEQPGQREVG